MTHTLMIAALALAGAAEPESPEAKAKALMAALAKEDFAAATKDFDATMSKVLAADNLGPTWKRLVGQVGALKTQGTPVKEKLSEKGKDYEIVFVPCAFEKMRLYTRVVFTPDGKVTGLQFSPNGPAGEYKAPAYVKRDAFKDVDVTVGEGEWALPGTLSLPAGAGPFPAVVLVHGSGPQDRDERIGPNRPFRDLAGGLASRGIAVLRYEKRTKQHGARMTKDVTVKEETVDDALAAAALLRTTKGVDAKKVFVLGHSLGAMAAPRLGELDPALAGLIVMACPARPLEDVVVDQVAYILSLAKEPGAEQKAGVEKIKEQAARLKDPNLPKDTPAKDLPLGAPLAYWRSVAALRPVETAAKVAQPVFVLQGGRDYQVTMEDFGLWEKAVGGRKNVTLKSYPKLNHLFAEGEGKAKPEEYSKEGHVAAEVVEDLARWVKGQ